MPRGKKGTKAAPKKAAPKQPRKKKLKLTNAEQRLLLFPPTETTWRCIHKDGFEVVVPGSERQCWHCRKAKPAKPKLLWPDYVKLCEKVGIEPGYRWKLTDNGPMMQLKGEAWKSAPEV
jgi:hypothetical protein